MKCLIFIHLLCCVVQNLNGQNDAIISVPKLILPNTPCFELLDLRDKSSYDSLRYISNIYNNFYKSHLHSSERCFYREISKIESQNFELKLKYFADRLFLFNEYVYLSNRNGSDNMTLTRDLLSDKYFRSVLADYLIDTKLRDCDLFINILNEQKIEASNAFNKFIKFFFKEKIEKLKNLPQDDECTQQNKLLILNIFENK